MAYFRPHHRKGGITEQQWRVIRVLYLDGEMDAGDLAPSQLSAGAEPVAHPEGPRGRRLC